MYLRKSVMQVCLYAVLLLLCGMAVAEETVYENVVNRSKEAIYVISNLPQDQIMRPICKEALNRNNHCRYVPLGEVGMFGKHKSDLTDYNWRKENETVVVVDRSKLDVGQKVSLQRLMSEVFPTVEESEKSQVLLRAQNVGDRAWQVLIDVPEDMWLDQAIPDLMSSIGECQMVKDVQSVVTLSNTPSISTYMLSWFRYGKKQDTGLDKWQEFRDASGASHKILAINWNGTDECTPEAANEILPPDLRAACDRSGADRMGLTPWHKMCREAVADVRKVDSTDYWVIRAPTEKHLKSLADAVVRSNFTGGPFRLDLCDLTHIRSLAVGTYLASPDLNQNRGRLVLQQEMETGAQQFLQPKVRSMYSAQNWGEIVQTVLGEDTGSPFVDSSGAQKVVQASQADALLVLWVREATPATEYSCSSERLTPRLPEFSQPEPVKPDPEDRKCLFCGHKYPGESREIRAQSDEFRRDYREWQQQYDRWDRDKRDYERKKQSHQVNWQYTLLAVPKVTLVGYLKIIDLKTQTQLWTCPVDLTLSGDSQLVRTVPAQVYGDDEEPEQPNMPENEYEWDNATYVVGQEAFLSGLKQGLGRLADTALWANDMKPWNAPAEVAVQIPVEISEPVVVSIEKVGSMPCASSPTGPAKTKLSKAAKDDAISQIFEEAQAKYPSAGITSELISEKAVVASEGWNPKDKEYRVRVKFETETTN